MRAQQLGESCLFWQLLAIAPVGLPSERTHGVMHVGVVDEPLLAVLEDWVVEYEVSHGTVIRYDEAGTSLTMIRFVPPAIPARPAVMTTFAPGSRPAKSRAPISADSISSSTLSEWSIIVG